MAPAVQPLAIGDRRFFNRQKHVSSLGTFTLVGHTFQLVDSCTDAVGIELCCAKTRVLKSPAAHQAAVEKKPILWPFAAATILSLFAKWKVRVLLLARSASTWIVF